jgi:hypothetical protein
MWSLIVMQENDVIRICEDRSFLKWSFMEALQLSRINLGGSRLIDI